MSRQKVKWVRQPTEYSKKERAMFARLGMTEMEMKLLAPAPLYTAAVWKMFIQPVDDKEATESLRRCAVAWDEGIIMRSTPDWDALISC